MLAKIGHFEILELVGRGAMGAVYRAVDPLIGRSVAIKLIRLIGYHDGEEAAFLKDRLFKEAKAAGGLSHPGIVTIYQVGTQDDQAFIAMEYIDGVTLESRLDSGKSIDDALFSRVLVEMAAALDYAHQRGIVHRDIKPANIMLTAGGAVKITDFGIAKTLLGRTVTQAGMILGTPFYMSPEQVQGQPLDGRSDQFALAVIAYQMLTGRRPFDGQEVTSICYQIVHAEPASPADLNPNLRPEVARVLKRALEKNPANRFPTCAEFAAGLVSACEQAAARPRAEASHRSNNTTAILPESLPARPAAAPKFSPPASNISPAAAKQPLFRKYMFQFGAMAGTLAAAALIGGAALLVRPRAIDQLQAVQSMPRAPLSATISQAPPVPTPAASRAAAENPEKAASVMHLEKKDQNRKPARFTMAQADVSRRAVADRPAFRPGGRIIWTGHAPKGTLLTIEGAQASTGRVYGRLPGAPVDVRVFPAEDAAGGLTVFTSEEQYATPVRQATAAGQALISWDPRHVMDVTVWEQPGPGNAWGKLVLRVNSGQLTACMIEWKETRR